MAFSLIETGCFGNNFIFRVIAAVSGDWQVFIFVVTGAFDLHRNERNAGEDDCHHGPFAAAHGKDMWVKKVIVRLVFVAGVEG